MVESLRQRTLVETDEFYPVRVRLDRIGALLKRPFPLRQIAEAPRGKYVFPAAETVERDAGADPHRFGEIIGEIAGDPAHERRGRSGKFDHQSVAEHELVGGGPELHIPPITFMNDFKPFTEGVLLLGESGE